MPNAMMAYSTIIIAGGGIIGNSISYYLAKRGIPCAIIDPVGIAPAASGKAGGFLARNWSDRSPVQELQRRSFDLHAEQAETDPGGVLALAFPGGREDRIRRPGQAGTVVHRDFIIGGGWRRCGRD